MYKSSEYGKSEIALGEMSKLNKDVVDNIKTNRDHVQIVRDSANEHVVILDNTHMF